VLVTGAADAAPTDQSLTSNSLIYSTVMQQQQLLLLEKLLHACFK
jgi:hypothetical protein